MSVTTDIIEMLQRGQLDEKLFDIYVDETQIDYQRKRYVNAINEYEMVFGTDEIEIFSAPGRSEIAGNHTDHQRGEVLVAAVNVDAIAIVRKTDKKEVQLVSEGYSKMTISLDDLEAKKEEAGTTLSLVKLSWRP